MDAEFRAYSYEVAARICRYLCTLVLVERSQGY
jgi:hypothetical protein